MRREQRNKKRKKERPIENAAGLEVFPGLIKVSVTDEVGFESSSLALPKVSNKL